MSTSNGIPLRVAINAYFIRHPHTGSGQYLNRLLATLPHVAPECPLAVIPSPSGGGPLAKLWFEQASLPRAAARSATLVHYPYWAAPVHSSLPVVVTVHDLIPLLLEHYRGSRLVRSYTALVAYATRRAAMLIADSEATKRDVVARLEVPPERVRVIYLAAAEQFRPDGDGPDGNGADAVKARYRLDRPFIFYVGGLDRRKNVDRLIEAFSRARGSFATTHLLAIAGDPSRHGALFPDLPERVRALGLTDHVRFLGMVPDGDLPALYRACAAFVFPSSYEGFGLPPLEAMACGAPVVSSNGGSLPEVVGDAAVVIDPANLETFASALARVLNDRALATDLRRRGPARAAQFTWQKTAAETAAVYHEAVGRWGHSKR